MPKAYVGDVLIAESDETIVVEGNHYFPPESVQSEYLSDSARTSVCPWKGTASYYDVSVDGQNLPAVAWYYPSPKERASAIAGYVAFYPAVRVTD